MTEFKNPCNSDKFAELLIRLVKEKYCFVSELAEKEKYEQRDVTRFFQRAKDLELVELVPTKDATKTYTPTQKGINAAREFENILDAKQSARKVMNK